MFELVISACTPTVVDLPAGAGKADLIAIWLITQVW